MPQVNSEDHTTFIQYYGSRFFNDVKSVIEGKNAPLAMAYLVYFIEMCEEVLYKSQNFDLIGTELYGYQHNKELNALDMNYLIEQEVAFCGDLTYEKVLGYTNRFFKSKSRLKNGEINAPMIRVLPFFIRLLQNVIQESGQKGRLKPNQLAPYVDAHNKAVFAHLTYRVNRPDISISEYRSKSDVLESKAHLVFQRLSESYANPTKVLAAFVYLNAQEGRYKRQDVVGLTGLTKSEVATHLEWLCDHRFLARIPGQNYNSTEIVFNGLSPDEAYNLVDTDTASVVTEEPDTEEPVQQEFQMQVSSLENLSWHEALLYTAIRDLTDDDGIVKIGSAQLVMVAFRGYYASSGGAISEALVSLDERGWIARITGTSPHSYVLYVMYDDASVFSHVVESDSDDLNMILERDPVLIDVELEATPVAPEEEEEEEVASGVTEQEMVNYQMESLFNNIVDKTLRVVAPKLAQKVFDLGQLSMEHDEQTGTTKITFSYTPPEPEEESGGRW